MASFIPSTVSQNITVEKQADIVSLYVNKRMNLKDIAKIHGTYPNMVRLILTKSGVTIRKRGGFDVTENVTVSKSANDNQQGTKVLQSPKANETKESKGVQAIKSLLHLGIITQSDIDSLASKNINNTEPNRLTKKQLAREDFYRRIRNYISRHNCSELEAAKQFDCCVGTVRRARGKK